MRDVLFLIKMFLTHYKHHPQAVVLLGDYDLDMPLDVCLQEIADLTEVWWIAGNHDFGFEAIRKSNEVGIAIPQGVIYLQDEMVEIEGIKIYGSPWQPRFHDWAFNVDRGAAIAQKWDMIPEDVDILITHGPPFGILDDTIQGQRVGCEDLYMKVTKLKPKYHIFGHIHYGYGMRIMEDTTYINASCLGERYEYRNKPISFYI